MELKIVHRKCGRELNCIVLHNVIQVSDCEACSLTKCPICSKPITLSNVSRKDDNTRRYDADGRLWCKECTHEFDKVECSKPYNFY